MKHFKTLLATLLLLTAFVANAGNIPSKIWIVGDATDWGWRDDLHNQDGAVNRPAKNEGGWYVYTWQNVALKPGELKFLYTEDSNPNISWDKAYVYSDPKQKEISATDARKIGMTWFTGSDNKWTIAFTGKYDVTVRISENSESNIRDMYLTVESVDNRFTENYAARKIYLRGGATPNGWKLSSASTKMDFDPETGKHTATDVQLTAATTGISDGLMRFTQFEDNEEKGQLCASTDKNPSILATSKEQKPNEASVNVAFGTTGEWNWSVPKTGKYNIEIQAPPYDEDFNGYANYTVTFTYLPETFTDRTITAIGAAVEGTAPKFTHNGNGKYTARVYLKGSDTAGDFALKFADTTTADATTYYTATPVTDETYAVVDGTTNDAKVTCSATEPTNAWSIKQPGFYDITLQLLNDEKLKDGAEVGTVSFKKVTFASGDIYLVGGATPNTWTLTEASTKMDYSDATGKYTQTKVLLKAKGVKGSDGLLRFSKGYGDLSKLDQLCHNENTANGTKAIYIVTEGTEAGTYTPGNFDKLSFLVNGQNNWSVPTTGYYTIEIQAPETGATETTYNVTFKYVAEYVAPKEYKEHKIYPVGSAIYNIGWSPKATTALKYEGNGKYTGEIGIVGYGETAPAEDQKDNYALKFLLDAQDWGKGLCAASAYAPAVSADNTALDIVYANSASADNKWIFSKSGIYTVTVQLNDEDNLTVDSKAGTVTFALKEEKSLAHEYLTDLKIYPVGGATESNWNWTEAPLDHLGNGKYQRLMYLKGSKQNSDENAIKFGFQQAFDLKELHADKTWAPGSYKPSVAKYSTHKESGVADYKWYIPAAGWYIVTVQMRKNATLDNSNEVADVTFAPKVWQYGASVWPEGVNNNTTDAFDPTVYSKEVVCDANGNYTGTFTVTSSSPAEHHTIRFAKFDKDMKLASWYSPVDAQEDNVYHVKLTASVACEEIPNGAEGATDYYWSVPEDATGEFSYTFNPFNENGKNFSIKGIPGKYTVSSALYCNDVMAGFTEGKDNTTTTQEASWWTYTSKVKDSSNNEVDKTVYYWQGHLMSKAAGNKLFQLYTKDVDGTKTYYIVKDQNLTDNDIYKMNISSEATGAASLDVTRPIGTNSEWIIPRENKFGVFPTTEFALTTTTDASKAHYFGLTEGAEGHYIMTLDNNNSGNIVLTARTYHRSDQDNDFQTAVETVAGEGSLSVGRVGDTLWVSGANGGEVLVVSMTGARMASSAGAEAVEISMEGWPNGIYIVCGNGKAVKIVK